MIDDGILVLNKPRDWTSHDCVAICRRVLRLKGVKKIGHGGTLDPMAEGVLPIFIGQATRIMEYLELDEKTYECQMQLGMTTDTQDIWGTVLDRKDWEAVGEADVIRALEDFRGPIEQMPPMYSAVRIDGRHLYDYARKGRLETDEDLAGRIRPRRVYISDLTIREIDPVSGRIAFTVTCSKGTYIRTICSDLGERLGCGGVMTGLRRTAIGRIDLTRSVSPEEIKKMDGTGGRIGSSGGGECAGSPDGEPADPGGDPAGGPVLRLEDLLLPVDAPLVHFGRVRMPEDRAHYFRQGNPIRLHQIEKVSEARIDPDPLTGRIPCNARGRRYDRIYRVYQKENGLFLGTGYEDRGQRVLRADKVFTALNEPKAGKAR